MPHVPGYKYLGPGTDIHKKDKPINDLDNFARAHDHDYDSPYKNIWQADKEFIARASQSKDAPLLGFSVRNYSVVRKSLLSASATNVFTYNTAPDVNLVFATERNKVTAYSINEKERRDNQPYIRQPSSDLDTITLTHEECPSKHVWHRTVHMSRPDNFIFEPPTTHTSLKDMAFYTLPIYNGSLSVQTLNEARWSGVQTAKVGLMNIEQSCMVIKDGFTPNPYTIMGVYKIPDDTGFMKFIVRIELTSRLDVTFHLDSDYESNADLQRFRKHLPWKKRIEEKRL
ncbi:hypothetical protein GQR58_012810 [Nymphon striatum]|nr:hypothetical protein GQR58_012810 [Nymphon striatum]